MKFVSVVLYWKLPVIPFVFKELQMDQQAKRHLQEEFDACLEEKDQYISVLQTQVRVSKGMEASAGNRL